MKAIESVIHLRREEPKRLRSMVPEHVWRLVSSYGIEPSSDEKVSRRD
jgi:coenzyme F420 hydrogenase subunit beta